MCTVCVCACLECLRPTGTLPHAHMLTLDSAHPLQHPASLPSAAALISRFMRRQRKRGACIGHRLECRGLHELRQQPAVRCGRVYSWESRRLAGSAKDVASSLPRCLSGAPQSSTPQHCNTACNKQMQHRSSTPCCSTHCTCSLAHVDSGGKSSCIVAVLLPRAQRVRSDCTNQACAGATVFSVKIGMLNIASVSNLEHAFAGATSRCHRPSSVGRSRARHNSRPRDVLQRRVRAGRIRERHRIRKRHRSCGRGGNSGGDPGDQ